MQLETKPEQQTVLILVLPFTFLFLVLLGAVKQQLPRKLPTKKLNRESKVIRGLNMALRLKCAQTCLSFL